MGDDQRKPGSDLFIVDNSDADWKVRNYLTEWCGLAKTIDSAAGYFEIGALLALRDAWQTVDHIRILMGDEVSRRTQQAFREALGRIRDRPAAGRVDRTNRKADAATQSCRTFVGYSVDPEMIDKAILYSGTEVCAYFLALTSLTKDAPLPILLVTHSPRLSPARAMRIKGEFFYAPVGRAACGVLQ